MGGLISNQDQEDDMDEDYDSDYDSDVDVKMSCNNQYFYIILTY